jgi:hypothetical protein
MHSDGQLQSVQLLTAGWHDTGEWGSTCLSSMFSGVVHSWQQGRVCKCVSISHTQHTVCTGCALPECGGKCMTLRLPANTACCASTGKCFCRTGHGARVYVRHACFDRVVTLVTWSQRSLASRARRRSRCRCRRRRSLRTWMRWPTATPHEPRRATASSGLSAAASWRPRWRGLQPPRACGRRQRGSRHGCKDTSGCRRAARSTRRSKRQPQPGRRCPATTAEAAAAAAAGVRPAPRACRALLGRPRRRTRATSRRAAGGRPAGRPRWRALRDRLGGAHASHKRSASLSVQRKPVARRLLAHAAVWAMAMRCCRRPAAELGAEPLPYSLERQGAGPASCKGIGQRANTACECCPRAATWRQYRRKY